MENRSKAIEPFICPECGQRGILRSRTYPNRGGQGSNVIMGTRRGQAVRGVRKWNISCSGCGKKTAFYMTIEEAEEDWAGAKHEQSAETAAG